MLISVFKVTDAQLDTSLHLLNLFILFNIVKCAITSTCIILTSTRKMARHSPLVRVVRCDSGQPRRRQHHPRVFSVLDS